MLHLVGRGDLRKDLVFQIFRLTDSAINGKPAARLLAHDYYLQHGQAGCNISPKNQNPKEIDFLVTRDLIVPDITWSACRSESVANYILLAFRPSQH